jgi:hypothetical protein
MYVWVLFRVRYLTVDGIVCHNRVSCKYIGGMEALDICMDVVAVSKR